jgi:hypothetical protein
MNLTSDEAEEVVQNQARIFEENKSYLLKRFEIWKD